MRKTTTLLTRTALPFFTSVVIGITSPATSVLASVSLHLPENIEIVAVNGKSEHLVKRATLSDGTLQLAVLFKGIIGDNVNETNPDKTDLVSSDVFIIKFSADNTSLELVTAPIRSTYELEKFNKNPQFRLLTDSGANLSLEQDRLEKEGFQLLRDYEVELRKFNSGNSPAALHQVEETSHPQQTETAPSTAFQTADHPSKSPAVIEAKPVKKKSSVAPTQQSEMAEKMLQYWYQQASPEERKKFRDWLQNQ